MTQWRLYPGYDTPALREAFGSLDQLTAAGQPVRRQILAYFEGRE